MPIHDWTRVPDEVFRSFHLLWVARLMGDLNNGVLSPDYYAMVEQERPRRSTRPRRHIAIRHTTDQRQISLIEIVSPATRDRRGYARGVPEKVVRNLQAGVHVLVLDLFPPGRFDPHGLHDEIWAHFDREPYAVPEDAPLTLASYAWGESGEPTAFVEPTAIGRPLIEMPLFLTADRYINTPLEATYTSAFRGIPDFYRELLEAPPT